MLATYLKANYNKFLEFHINNVSDSNSIFSNYNSYKDDTYPEFRIAIHDIEKGRK